MPVQVSWSPAANAVKYKVVATTPGGPNTSAIFDSSPAVPGIVASKPYTITVTGINSAGVEGPESEPVAYEPPPVPDQVQGVSVQVV